MTSPPDQLRPAVFLDRDGTIMQDVNYCARPEHVRVFSGVREALSRLKEAGYRIIIITNQSGIGRGYFGEEDYRAVERELERQLGDGLIDASYFCGDTPDSGSRRRKPEPAMVFEAAREHGLDVTRSYFIGDKQIDVECGRNAGARTITVKTGKQEPPTAMGADWIARDLPEAADIILRHGL